MNTYEALIIFKPILDVENVDAILNHFQKNIVEANQGTILDVDKIGRKRLAYEIKKFKDGFLTIFHLKLPPNKVADFRRTCQINEDVLRITLMRLDSYSPEAAAASRASAAEESSHFRRDYGDRPRRRPFNKEFSGPPRGEGAPTHDRS